jgi:hypothetical protein
MGFGSTWRPAASSRGQYADNAGRIEYVRALAADPPGGLPNPNLLAFTNGGGLLGKGVCWWHSRFTRAALYLAYFEPDSPRPARREVRDIIATLMDARGVVAIPGYASLREFSEANRGEIQKLLERRQLQDGVLRFAWVDGLTGSPSVESRRLEDLMDRIHAETLEGLAYVKLQIRGLDAHSLVFTEMEPLRGGGYRCSYLDSNWPGERIWEYRAGLDPVSAATGIPGVPYLQRTRELRRMKLIIERFRAEGSRC